MISCPVTVVKTRMEYGGPGVPAYRGTLHALGTIARTEGLRGLYRGLGPTILSNAPFSAIYYMFYTRLQVRRRVGRVGRETGGRGPSLQLRQGRDSGPLALLFSVVQPSIHHQVPQIIPPTHALHHPRSAWRRRRRRAAWRCPRRR